MTIINVSHQLIPAWLIQLMINNQRQVVPVSLGKSHCLTLV